MNDEDTRPYGAQRRAGSPQETDHKKLIEEARARTTEHARQNPEGSVDIALRLADALEAAEKPITPTDDEREARLEYVIDAAVPVDEFPSWRFRYSLRIADAVSAAGFRRTEGPEPRRRMPGWTHPDAVYSPEVFMAVQGLLNEAKGSPTHALRIAVSRQLSEPQGEPSDAQAERERIIADLREWSRPLGNSPEEETLRLVIERIERAAGVGGVR